MKPYQKIVTHLGALVIGIALAAALRSVSASSPDGSNGRKPANTGAAAGASNKSPASHSRAAAGSGRSAAFRSAWAALAKEPLTGADRFNAQRDLLAKWAEIDLDGALEAFLGEAWDNRDPANPWNPLPLARAFSKVFAEHPMESWQSLGRDKMAFNLLAGTWMNSVVGKEPNLVISMMSEFPRRVQEEAIARTIGQANSFPEEKRKELLTKLATSGSQAEVERWLSQASRDAKESRAPGEISAKWSAMPEGGPRTLEMVNWAKSLHAVDVETFSNEWSKIPDEDRGQAARLLLKQVDNQSPALLTAIERAIETKQWQAFTEDDIAGKLRGFNTDRQALAEWALTIPQREETRSVFNLAISEKLLADPVGGRAWLEQLPAGDWHREWGFVEMTLGQIWVRGDVAAASRAINAIHDERARQEAIKVLYDWQLITAQGKVMHDD